MFACGNMLIGAGGNIPSQITAVSFDLPFFTNLQGLALDPVSVQFLLDRIYETTLSTVNETQALDAFTTCFAYPPAGNVDVFSGFDSYSLSGGAAVDIASIQCTL